MTDLTGRLALVTGGNRGIGRAVALALAGAGADVAIGYHARTADAEETTRAIAALGRKAVAIQADVARADDIRRMIDTTTRELGDVDVLINNAGIIRPQPLDAITEQDWHELIAANLTSVFLATQAVLPAMRAKAGDASSISPPSRPSSAASSVRTTRRRRPGCTA
jgi:3-oxoacyl-[acyl-carrier protein] reductase